MNTTGSRAPTPAPSAGRNAGLVGAGILVSRLVGFVRTWFLARYLGTSAEADVYTMAQRIPNALRNLLGEGTLSAAFVPVYSALLGRAEVPRANETASREADDAAARALANGLLGVLLLSASVLTIIGIVAAPLLTQILAPGFEGAKAELTTRLMRVLFPMSALMVISGWCLGVQNSHRRFFMSYASAAMWSLAQIVLLAGWGSKAESLQQLAWWLAWATLAGAALQVAVQLPEVWRLTGPLRPTLARGNDDVRAVIRNVFPAVGALGVVQLSGFADGFIASLLSDGAVGALNYANLIMLLPVSLFGIAVSASSLPESARAQSSAPASTGAGAPSSAIETDDVIARRASARTRVSQGWLRILFYVLPSAAVFIAFGDLVIGMLLRSGLFGDKEQALVHATLAAYSVGLVAFASNRLFATVFHAAQDYKTPLRFSMVSVAVSIIVAASLAYAFRAHPFATAGIALGAAVGSWVNFSLLSAGARKIVGPLLDTPAQRVFWRIIVLTIVAGISAFGVRAALPELHRWIEGPVVLGAFSLVYLVTSWWNGSAEAARWLRLRVREATSPAGDAS